MVCAARSVQFAAWLYKHRTSCTDKVPGTECMPALPITLTVSTLCFLSGLLHTPDSKLSPAVAWI